MKVCSSESFMFDFISTRQIVSVPGWVKGLAISKDQVCQMDVFNSGFSRKFDIGINQKLPLNQGASRTKIQISGEVSLLIAATYQYLKQYYVLYTQVGSCSFKFAYRKSNILFWISIVYKLCQFLHHLLDKSFSWSHYTPLKCNDQMLESFPNDLLSQ